LIGRDSSPNEALLPSEATFSQDDVEMNDDFHGDEGVRRTNSPPNIQAAFLKRYRPLNNRDPKFIFDPFNSSYIFPDGVSDIQYVALEGVPLRQAPPSPANGVCVPQRTYDKGTGWDDPNNQERVVFIREDGTYLPVKEALEEIYGSLKDKDTPALVEVGDTMIIRFEVNEPSTFRDTLKFIGCTVAGIPVHIVSGGSAEIVLPGGG
jgi:hypothetical protein